jgi:hypothetical protein
MKYWLMMWQQKLPTPLHNFLAAGIHGIPAFFCDRYSILHESNTLIEFVIGQIAV